MKATSFGDMPCSIARSLDVIGPWWALLIVRDAFMGIRRFKDFEKSLGIAKNTLTARLNGLVEGDILEKVPDAKGSKYLEYQLTDKGRALFPVIVALSQWGDNWAVHEDGPSFEIIDTRDGEPIPQQHILGKDGQPIPRQFLGQRPGPGTLAQQRRERTA